jgi:hypothetical protein
MRRLYAICPIVSPMPPIRSTGAMIFRQVHGGLPAFFF